MTVSAPSPRKPPVESEAAEELPSGLTATCPFGWKQALIGAAIGAAIYLIIVGPYWIYQSRFDSLASSVPRLTALLGPNPWLGRVVSSVVNLFSLVAFGIAVAFLWNRRKALMIQQRWNPFGALPAGDSTLILPEDALEARKQLRGLSSAERQFVETELVLVALQRARANWSAEDVSTAVRGYADVRMQQAESEYSIVRYLAWSIPSLGFIGTVMGVGDAIFAFGDPRLATSEAKIQAATGHLYVAFDTTLVALVLSLILMLFLHIVQAKEDAFWARAVKSCMERFVLRMHITKET